MLVTRVSKLTNVEHTMDINVSEEKLSRIVRATFIDKYPPFIVLHGYRFNLESDKKTDNH